MTTTKILITGAAGRIGRTLRHGLRRDDRIIRLADVAKMVPAENGEEIANFDLGDLKATTEAMQDIDVLIHLAAIPDERPWGEIFPTNFLLAYNAFEAARRAGTKRIIFASSIQAVGFHPIEQRIDETVRLRPSGFYGVSKAFGEALGSLYADRHGISFCAVRIASFEEKPSDVRMLKTWLSPRDTVELFNKCLDAPVKHFFVVYGVSANAGAMVDNSHVDWLDYRPEDDGEVFRADVERDGNLLDEIAKLTHGGDHCAKNYSDPGRKFLKN